MGIGFTGFGGAAGNGCGCCGCPNGPHCVQDCATGALISGATITVKDLSGTVVDSCTTDASGCCTLDLPGADTYESIISKSGYIDYHVVSVLSCGGNTLTWLDTLPAVSFLITGCCGKGLPGATVTFRGVDYTTDSSGRVKIGGGQPPGTYPYTVAASRFNDATGNVTLATLCSTTSVGINMAASPATGYSCAVGTDAGGDHPWAVPTTLHLTDSILGSVTLTGSGGSYSGSITVSVGKCGCATKSVTITYTLAGSCTSCSLQLTYAVNNTTFCPDDAGTGTISTTPVNLTVAAGPTFSASGGFTVPGPFGCSNLYGPAGTVVSYSVTE